MTWLLDTNVISETVKPRPERSVISWIASRTPNELFLPAQTVGELVRGARKLKDARQRSKLENWIAQDLARQFEGRILVFDGPAATVWGELMGDGDRKGRTPPAADAQIAALAIRHEMILVTRNEKDFSQFDLELLNPWQTHGSAAEFDGISH